MRFTVTIECNNEAFTGNAMTEVARILERQARKLRSNDDGLPDPVWSDTLLDVNGNNVGGARMLHGMDAC